MNKKEVQPLNYNIKVKGLLASLVTMKYLIFNYYQYMYVYQSLNLLIFSISLYCLIPFL